MQHVLLDRASHRPAAPQPLLGELALARARVHEVQGPARALFALLLARETEGPLFWIMPGWEPDRLYGPGVMALGVDPGRITFVYPGHAPDLLWTLEEVLRSGAIGLAVAELPVPPGLTPMRRLQLAAEAGAEASGRPPLGLVLTPTGRGTAAGAESRWHMAPDHGPDRRAWRLIRERARTAPPGDWRVEPRGEGFGLGPA